MGHVLGARRLADGRIVIADLLGLNLRVYSPEGEHLVDIGGQGDGPGELRTLSYFDVYGDTLVAYSHFNPALHRFSAEGAFLSSTPLQPTGNAAAKSVLAIGYLMDSRQGVGTSTPDWEELANGLQQAPTPMFVLELDESAFVQLAEYNGLEQTVEMSGSAVRFGVYPFGKNTATATSHDRIYVAPTDATLSTYTTRNTDSGGLFGVRSSPH